MPKATGPVYKVAYKRRRQNLTNYAKRLALVKSGSPRMVVRKSRRAVCVQFITFDAKGDNVIACATSRDLSKYGFSGRRNSPSAYLTGMLAARLAAHKKVKEFVLDMGIATPSKGALAFAAVQGAVDAGLATNYEGKMIDQSRIKGEHIAAYAKTAKPGTQFCAYAKQNFKPAEITTHFNSAKQKIMEAKW